ncbi:EF-hand domain-containing protein [Chthonobacter albigriseus]|uniref:EF-hand domain-containing protein n=1 Tax=Chthonobacter albigriseus TaxID=1683161 RepID=UPI0015EE8458|nr:EF-hand domain-containing protein [Chthonobacter albigriseus]
MKTLTWTAVVVAAFAATIPVANADMGGNRHGREHGGRHGGGMAMMMMERFDTDKDGKITQAEIDAVQTERFKAATADGNQTLSIAEFEPLFNQERREQMVRAFQRLDADGDGQVTREEFDDRTAGMVARMDRNNDGALSREDRGQRGEGHGWRRWFGGGEGGEGRGPMGGEGGRGPGPNGPMDGDDTE